MSNSGNRNGYKCFSFTTTIRNPNRNVDFLTAFLPYNNQVFDKKTKLKYMFSLIAEGIYTVTNVSESIRNKINNNEQLTDKEVKKVMDENPQATRWTGRVMTQLRGLKDEGLLVFDEVKSKTYRIKLTKYGEELLNTDPENAKNIYTKLMLGSYGKSPIRTTIKNASRPFLNTIFVIDGVNKKWEELGNDPKGILMHEFSLFVLTMKDCNYKEIVNKIIEYRKKYKYEYNYKYAQKYLEENSIESYEKGSFDDYADDVFRKFAATELIIQHGAFNYIYINFSSYNLEKIKSIITTYKNYSWESYQTKEEYYNYLYSIELPWDKDEEEKKKIIQAKVKKLNENGARINAATIANEQEIDRIYYDNSLKQAIERYKYETLIKELLILGDRIKARSIFHDIDEPLRLEYVTTLLIGKRYGIEHLVPNMTYDENGFPLHYAGARKCDLKYSDGVNAYIFELTMQTGKAQVMNETSSVLEHLISEEKKEGIVHRGMLIAPKISEYTSIFYFGWSLKQRAFPISINRFALLIDNSDHIEILNKNYDEIFNNLKNMEQDVYTDYSNDSPFDESRIKQIESDN